MKWTPVDSYGLDVVLKLLAKRRVVHAREKLQNAGFGLTHTPSSQPDYHRRVISPGHGLYICFCHFGGSARWL